ncbi:response regulator [Epilithonimonas hungarica]|jgi:Response regulator containing CheY-like receiver, AAA-type ATPase, and DNA-binding domains|uniref:Two-component system, cell cycle response regulator DivK n=1 Tax=Epilithonimonas hungarica TaxID=454006 RepID=A0A1G7SH02_9FLAO|nr:response regulator [Epilithonimonas hungarica]SDG22184.1 two-component system, cell cycle response regulator DivK [Epilithonimonas hungarica]
MGKKKILIFDDDTSILEVVSIIFEDNGYEVEIAETADDIISRVNVFLPDLILMDVYIPVIGGIEATRLLKDHIVHNRIPVIFITAKNDAAFISSQSSVVDYLSKPFDLGELERKVEKWIS